MGYTLQGHVFGFWKWGLYVNGETANNDSTKSREDDFVTSEHLSFNVDFFLFMLTKRCSS